MTHACELVPLGKIKIVHGTGLRDPFWYRIGQIFDEARVTSQFQVQVLGLVRGANCVSTVQGYKLNRLRMRDV